MAKKIYIAAPFFNPEQLALVQEVERAIISTDGLDYYSPRADGVLNAMTPEARATAAPHIFALNVKMIEECASVLALVEFKDTGTTWETGYAFGKKPVFAYTRKHEPLNVMLRQCFDAVVYDADQLARFLQAYAQGTLGVAEFAPKGETY